MQVTEMQNWKNYEELLSPCFTVLKYGLGAYEKIKYVIDKILALISSE